MIIVKCSHSTVTKPKSHHLCHCMQTDPQRASPSLTPVLCLMLNLPVDCAAAHCSHHQDSRNPTAVFSVNPAPSTSPHQVHSFNWMMELKPSTGWRGSVWCCIYYMVSTINIAPLSILWFISSLILSASCTSTAVKGKGAKLRIISAGIPTPSLFSIDRLEMLLRTHYPPLLSG